MGLGPVGCAAGRSISCESDGGLTSPLPTPVPSLMRVGGRCYQVGSVPDGGASCAKRQGGGHTEPTPNGEAILGAAITKPPHQPPKKPPPFQRPGEQDTSGKTEDQLKEEMVQMLAALGATGGGGGGEDEVDGQSHNPPAKPMVPKFPT